SDLPEVTTTSGAAGTRIARAIDERLTDAQAHSQTRIVDAPSRRWRVRERPPRDRDDGARDRGERRQRDRDRSREAAPPDAPLVRVTEASISVRLDANAWLNAEARLPGPRPAPISVLVGALISIVVVGIGAALVSRQIGRPLADLAGAARALGSGQTNV